MFFAALCLFSSILGYHKILNAYEQSANASWIVFAVEFPTTKHRSFARAHKENSNNNNKMPMHTPHQT